MAYNQRANWNSFKSWKNFHISSLKVKDFSAFSVTKMALRVLPYNNNKPMDLYRVKKWTSLKKTIQVDLIKTGEVI